MKRYQRWTVFLTAAGLFSWGFYLRILSPTVNLKDSGELITSAFTLGIAHPPGYPVYSMAAHLFASIPLGEIAFRVNAFSAFMGALGIVLGSLIIYELGGGLISAVGSSGLIGTSNVFLTTTLVSEVYTTEIAVLLLVVYWLIRPNNYRWSLFSLSLLLAMHPKNVIYCLPLLIYFFIVYRFRRKLNIKRGLISLMLLLLLLAFYLYLPLRASKNPALNWNRPVSLKSMLFHMSGKEYSGRILKPSQRQAALFLKNFYPTFRDAFGWPGLLLAASGFLSLLYFARFRLISLLMIIFVVNLLFGLLALDPVEGFLAHFYLPALFVTAILLGLGVKYVPLLIYDVWPFIQGEKLVGQIILLVVMGCFVVRLPLLSLQEPLTDRREDFVAYDFAVNQAKCLQPNAVIFAVGTRMTFPLKYLLYTLGKRKDVIMIEGGFLKPLYRDWYLSSLPLPVKIMTGNETASAMHHKLINYFLSLKPMFFAPLYSTNFSPLNTRLLPNDGQFMNYGMGNWLIPSGNLSKAAAFLRTTGQKYFSLRSYYQSIYQPTTYERYVFRKYNQFFRLTEQVN